MRRPLVVLAALALLFACGRVLFATPNDFPCDFSQGPGVRDQACVPGDVCGVNNLCQRYLYEGPRFEGKPSLPTFESATQLHPLQLSDPVLSVSRNRTPLGELSNVALTATGAWESVNRLVRPWPMFTTSTGFGAPVESAAYLNDNRIAVLQSDSTVQIYRAGGSETLDDTQGVGGAPVLARHVRGFANQAVVVTLAGDLGHVNTPAMKPVFFLDQVDAGVVDVVRLVHHSGASVQLVALTTQGLATVDGGVTIVAPFTADGGMTLDFDVASTVLTITTPDSAAVPHDTLSTWQVSDDFTLTLAWPDCAPCAHGHIEAVSPLPPALGLGVEVLCQTAGQTAGRTVVRVTGSTATDPTQSCETTPMDPKAPALTRGKPVSFGKVGGGGVLAGGSNGELFTGAFLSAALPDFLDRVPTDVGMVNATGTPAMLAVTDDYFAVQDLSSPSPNGFRRVDVVNDLKGSAGVTVLRTIGGVQGWGLLSNGVVTKVTPPMVQLDGGGVVGGLQFGPRLLTSNDQPISRAGGGEAFIGPDGGTLALYIAADDGVYALTGPAATLSDVATGNDSLGPQLNPEPSTPIRSFALERTPLGTDGVTRARGYLVTSRNVYSWQLGGTPPRWSATPLVLNGGEPVEVWFDRPRGAIARVGYRDGLVFTLPGGYQLTTAIPGDGGVAPQVFDYENLGGWPVAYASNGLFVAEYDLNADGTLANTFADGGLNRPMTWRAVTLPDGGQPWVGAPGKVFVKADPVVTTTGADAGTSQTFHLMLFLDHRVLELGTMVRTQ
jgi:hypothetical protein